MRNGYRTAVTAVLAAAGMGLATVAPATAAAAPPPPNTCTWASTVNNLRFWNTAHTSQIGYLQRGWRITGRINDRQTHGGLVFQGGTSPRHNNAKGYAAISLLDQVECWYDA